MQEPPTVLNTQAVPGDETSPRPLNRSLREHKHMLSPQATRCGGLPQTTPCPRRLQYVESEPCSAWEATLAQPRAESLYAALA